MSPVEQVVFDALAKFIGVQGTKKLRPAGLISKLSKATGLVQTEVRRGLAGLTRQKLVTGVNDSGDPLQCVGWTDPSVQPVPSHYKMVQAATELLSEKLSEKEQAAILRMSGTFKGLDQSVLIKIIEAALLLRDQPDCNATNRSDRYILSAKHFLSGSKVIDKLGKLFAVLGTPLPQDKPVYYALTAGSLTPKTVVFIENPRVFSFFAGYADSYDAMLISCYGYGLTLANFGELLKGNQVIMCPTDKNPGGDLNTLIDNARLLYWGDLDYEGIQIFEALQSSLPGLRLSGIYHEMLLLLASGSGHPYHALFGKEKQSPGACRTPEAQYIMAQLTQYNTGIDQEALCDYVTLESLFNSYELRAH